MATGHPRRVIVLILLVVLLAVQALALSSCQKGSSSSYEKAIEAARTAIWKDINSGKASSGQAAILDDGKIIYTEAFGMADRATSAPVTNSSLFNSGSIGKTYCTAAVMKLVDDKKVELDSPVTKYLPEFKMADPRYKDITVRMLLDHQSGIPGTTAANDFGYAVNPDLYSQVYENMARSHLKAAPGYSAPYCNDGFTLAEMLVAEVSGRKYIDYLTDEILKPLKLSKTGVSIGARPDAGVAAFYQPDTGKKVPPEAVSLLGAGGLSTTAEELVRFGDSFAKGSEHVLSQESIDDMTKAHLSTWAKKAVEQVGFNPELAYGLGFDAVTFPSFEEQGIKVVAKGGDTQDFHSELLVVPEKRIAVAVIEAGHGSSAAMTAIDVMEKVLEGKGLMKAEPAGVDVPREPQALPAEYESFAGLYDNGSELCTVTVDTGGGTVALDYAYSESYTLIHNDGYLYGPEDTKMAFLSVDGQTALVRNVIGLWITAAQKLPEAADPMSLEIDINGAQWLRRNVKPWESVNGTSGYAFESSTDPALPGFVIAGDPKLVESPTYAGVTSSVLRDLAELFLVEKDGGTWLQISDTLFSPGDTAAPMDVGSKSVTIGKDGYNEWLKTATDVVLEVEKPKADRVVVLGPDGSVVFDSVLDSGKVYVPAGSLITLAGSPGDAFTVTATSPARN